ncbi:MAG: DNA mismatch repair protein MutS [Nitrospinae bacterium]|nr:DNA mismatch repair protein MutS [Nitrospinota bacterium]
MSGLTPAMQQYREIKRRHRDAILFFRMGDFYEMFGEDARMASRLLEIALTTRQKGQENPIPMCGIPYHAAEAYIGKLISAGHKVAICDQMEEASESKDIVRREVTKVVTPGTVLSPSLLQEKENHYLCGIYPATEAIGLALLDHTTGEFAMAELAEPQALERLQEELCRFAPKEILIPPGQNCSSPLRALLEQTGAFLMDNLEEWAFEEGYARQQLLDHFRTVSLEGFGCEGMPAATIAAGVLLHYLKETQKGDLGHITRLSRYSLEETMFLDPATQRNLELTVSLSTGSREGSLLGILDKTVTAMGARKLRSWVLHPLKKLEEIERRQEGVAIFYEDLLLRERLRGLLKEVGDMERLMGRIVTGAANARDLLALKRSVQGLPQMRALLSGCPLSPAIEPLLRTWDDLEDLFQLIEAAIVPHPPLALKEGGLIREGYSRELDEIKEIGRHGKDWIAQLEATERERTGIVSLKVGYNRVFGYYIEVTRRNLERIPPDYQRRQTLVNAERFITPELKEWEEKVLGAEERIVELEYRLFDLVREEVARKAMRVQAMARTISQLDGLAALGEVAQEYDYVRPQLDEDEAIQIVEGRHPVLERLLPERFIPNDAHLDCSENQLLILTGPNMAGKSTYLRQVALIILMAQIGGFVPAREARLSIVDRIFTRVGAHDNLLRGQSTFMVEMSEAANIVNNATPRSLIVLDEIGRGTSTFDGISLAWAIAEYVHDRIGAKTLFATHYHELTELEGALRRVKNYSVAVRESDEKILFLRKILPGGMDKSYGIQVAQLAGLPQEILERAREVLSRLENGHLDPGGSLHPVGSPPARGGRIPGTGHALSRPRSDSRQLPLFPVPVHPVVQRLQEIEINHLTPLEALNLLGELQGMAKQGPRTNEGQRSAGAKERKA